MSNLQESIGSRLDDDIANRLNEFLAPGTYLDEIHEEETAKPNPFDLLEAGEPEPLLEAVNPVFVESFDEPETTSAHGYSVEASATELSGALERANELPAVEEPITAEAVTNRSEISELPSREIGQLSWQALDLINENIAYSRGEQFDDARMKAYHEKDAALTEAFKQAEAAGVDTASLEHIATMLDRSYFTPKQGVESEDAIRPDAIEAKKASAELSVGSYVLASRGSGFVLLQIMDRQDSDEEGTRYHVKDVDAETESWVGEAELVKSIEGQTLSEKVNESLTSAFAKIKEAGQSLKERRTARQNEHSEEASHEAEAQTAEIQPAEDEPLEEAAPGKKEHGRRRAETLDDGKSWWKKNRDALKENFRPSKWAGGLWDRVQDGFYGASARVTTALSKRQEAEDIRLHSEMTPEEVDKYKDRRRANYMIGIVAIAAGAAYLKVSGMSAGEGSGLHDVIGTPGAHGVSPSEHLTNEASESVHTRIPTVETTFDPSQLATDKDVQVTQLDPSGGNTEIEHGPSYGVETHLPSDTFMVRSGDGPLTTVQRAGGNAGDWAAMKHDFYEAFKNNGTLYTDGSDIRYDHIGELPKSMQQFITNRIRG